MENPKPHVVIVGGGFAGIEIVRRLLKHGAPVAVTMVSKNDTFEYYPGLYKLVTGAMPYEVSVPLRDVFPKGIEFIQGTYTGVQEKEKTITLENGRVISYDYLILALGCETNYFNIPGLAEQSFGFKSVAEALKLKLHFCELFVKSAMHTRDEMVYLLHVAVIGAGPSGVEVAGNLKAYLEELARENKVDPSLITVNLIEASPRILPQLPEKASKLAEKRLRALGVNIFTNRMLEKEDIEQITLKDMKMKAGTVIWGAGTQVNKAYKSLQGATFDKRGRVAVTPWLTLPTNNSIYIVGDGASTEHSGLAQTAIEHGAYVAYAIDRLVRGKPVGRHIEATNRVALPIGRNWALLVDRNGHIYKGFIPRIARNIADLRYFLSILPFHKVISIIRKGRKYKHLHGGCEIGE